MDATDDIDLAKRITGRRSEYIKVYNRVNEKRVQVGSSILKGTNGELSSSTQVTGSEEKHVLITVCFKNHYQEAGRSCHL